MLLKVLTNQLSVCRIGRFDRMTPKKVGLELASKIKNSKSVIIDDSGHTCLFLKRLK